jgi:hypothetical protein
MTSDPRKAMTCLPVGAGILATTSANESPSRSLGATRGVNYFDRLEPERRQRYLVRRLQALGYEVTVTRPEDPCAA